MHNFDADIRKVPDYPKKGILFYDITSLISNPSALRAVKELMVETYRGKEIAKIVAIESRGFLFAPLLADALQIPLVLARKKGKLPNKTFREEYTLEYGTDSIEIQEIDLKEKGNILVIDDLIATGGTLKAVINLIEKNSPAKVTDIFAVIGLPFLKYETVLKGIRVKTLVNYDTE